MMHYFLILATIIFAFLTTYHRTPWPTFTSEILAFISASVLLFVFINKKVEVNKPQLLAVPILCIPLIQLLSGQILYMSNALLSIAYIVMFWIMVVAGDALANNSSQREKLFRCFSLIFMLIGLLSSLIAIIQWIDLNHYFSPFMYELKGNRPYANMAQPNNLATLLIISLLSCLYIFEKKILKKRYLIPIAFTILFGIVLAQSRTSLIVSLFISIYWLVKTLNIKTKISRITFLVWIGLFVLLTFNLSTIGQFILSNSNIDISTTSTAAERAAKGMGDIRVEMWQQMWTAILQQPWFGYGWNQTGLAQYYVTDTYAVPLWYKSAHNILLDLLVWNGLILGGLIILYLSAWLIWLNKGIKDLISIIAAMMVCAILIHGMLEFPLHYAYFLLPAGFLLGVIQAQYKNLPSITINGKWFVIVGVVTILGCAVTVRDYVLYKEQSVIASQKTLLSQSQQKIMNQEIILLTQFKERVWWIQLDPKTKMTDEQLAYMERMVANMASKYDLYKFAQVLAYNGKEKEAKHQLWVLETLHKQKKSYEALLE